MPLQTSGQISLNDLHVEAGGTTGTYATMNDSDIRGLTPDSGRTINTTSGGETDMADFYGASNIDVTGGSFVTTVGGYKVHTFNSSGTLTFTTIPSGFQLEYFIVAGGGGAGTNGGGGGGAGGVRTGTLTDATYLFSGNSFTITVGAGGSTSNRGNNSRIRESDGTWAGISTATRGGGGADRDFGDLPTSGGSGGGGGGTGGTPRLGASGSTGQGNDGGDGYGEAGGNSAGGGGGGYSSAGGNGSFELGGDGGSGLDNNWIDGSNVGYAGGGAGSGLDYNNFGGESGDASHGGGGRNNGHNSRNGRSNSGGGGGGRGTGNNSGDSGGGAGGSGRVIVRYAI